MSVGDILNVEIGSHMKINMDYFLLFIFDMGIRQFILIGRSQPELNYLSSVSI